MAERGSGAKWLKYGCLGCLGVIGLLLLSAAALSGVALLRVRAETVADRVITPELPRIEPTAEAADPDAGATMPLRGAGRVELDLQGAAFWVEPGEPGEPLRVEARYDEASYELEERLETEGDAEWTYHLRFRKTGSSLFLALKELLGGTKPRVEIFLPPHLPISLELRIHQGGSEVELGGLWLTDAELEFGQGGLEVGFAEPVREPMEFLTLRGSMGGINASRLGNASPRNLTVDYSMGGMNLDLRGQWVRDARIEITTSMSGTQVQLPRDVLIEGLDRGRVSLPPEQEIKPPTLTFSVRGDNIEFSD